MEEQMAHAYNTDSRLGMFRQPNGTAGLIVGAYLPSETQIREVKMLTFMVTVLCFITEDVYALPLHLPERG
jgi:hypothetical protein